MFKKIEFGEGCAPVDVGGGLVEFDIKESVEGAHSEIVARLPGGGVEFLGGSSNRAFRESVQPVAVLPCRPRT